MRRRKFDLVHTTSLKADIWGGLAARLAGRCLLWHIHDRIANDYLPPIVVQIFRFLARCVPHGVLVNSRSTLKTLDSIPSDRIRVVHPGVPQVLLDSVEPEAKNADSPEPTRPSHPIVGIVGRISPTKGQDVFIRAAAKVACRFPDVRFQVIGGALFQHDGFEKEIRVLAAQLGLRNLEFLGFCDDVVSRMRKLTVLVHASPVPEPFGQVVVEAMAAGKPVIATDAGGIPEIVIDGECGFLVPVRDSNAMAEKICVLLANPKLAVALGRRGRARVAMHFTATRMAREIEELYEGVLGRKHKSTVGSVLGTAVEGAHE